MLELAVLLRERCPAHLKVMIAPFDVDLAINTRAGPGRVELSAPFPVAVRPADLVAA